MGLINQDALEEMMKEVFWETMPDPPEQEKQGWYQRTDAAKYLGVSPKTFDRWVKDDATIQKQRKTVKDITLYRKSDLDSLIERRGV